jgi:endonuclease YncB( thermonuclease family)
MLANSQTSGRTWSGALAFALLVCGCAPAADLSGRATVVDGDSLQMGGASIRIFGIDAPEGRQTCAREGRSWDCGETAARELRTLIGTRTLHCTERDIDTYGRIVAVCTNGETDLGAAMVRAGFALAYRQFSDAYVDEEREARDARRGIWVGSFTPPWDWRRNPTAIAPGASVTPPGPGADCMIKGNISRAGERIYHVPGSRSYEATRIDPSRGERWFCSAAEAQRAGWRAPRG